MESRYFLGSKPSDQKALKKSSKKWKRAGPNQVPNEGNPVRSGSVAAKPPATSSRPAWKLLLPQPPSVVRLPDERSAASFSHSILVRFAKKTYCSFSASKCCFCKTNQFGSFLGISHVDGNGTNV